MINFKKIVCLKDFNLIFKLKIHFLFILKYGSLLNYLINFLYSFLLFFFIFFIFIFAFHMASSFPSFILLHRLSPPRPQLPVSTISSLGDPLSLYYVGFVPLSFPFINI